MGIKKKQVPGCGCCDVSVPPAANCCNGTIPATMTIQISMVGSTTFPALEAIFGSPPGIDCDYPCLDLQGTWALTQVSPGTCAWCAETDIARVVGSCTDSGFETVRVGFYLWFSTDIDSVQRLKLTIIRSGCAGGSSYYEILAYAANAPTTAVCANWTIDEPLTPTASLYANGYGYCDADFDSITVSTP